MEADTGRYPIGFDRRNYNSGMSMIISWWYFSDHQSLTTMISWTVRHFDFKLVKQIDPETQHRSFNNALISHSTVLPLRGAFQSIG